MALFKYFVQNCFQSDAQTVYSNTTMTMIYQLFDINLQHYPVIMFEKK